MDTYPHKTSLVISSDKKWPGYNTLYPVHPETPYPNGLPFHELPDGKCYAQVGKTKKTDGKKKHYIALCCGMPTQTAGFCSFHFNLLDERTQRAARSEHSSENTHYQDEDDKGEIDLSLKQPESRDRSYRKAAIPKPRGSWTREKLRRRKASVLPEENILQANGSASAGRALQVASSNQTVGMGHILAALQEYGLSIASTRGMVVLFLLAAENPRAMDELRGILGSDVFAAVRDAILRQQGSPALKGLGSELEALQGLVVRQKSIAVDAEGLRTAVTKFLEPLQRKVGEEEPLRATFRPACPDVRAAGPSPVPSPASLSQDTPSIPEKLSFRNLLGLSGTVFGWVAIENILLPGRAPAAVENARLTGSCLGKTLLGLSSSQIGRILNYADHTTALYGIKKVGRLIREKDGLVCDKMSLILATIYKHSPGSIPEDLSEEMQALRDAGLPPPIPAEHDPFQIGDNTKNRETVSFLPHTSQHFDQRKFEDELARIRTKIDSFPGSSRTILAGFTRELIRKITFGGDIRLGSGDPRPIMIEYLTKNVLGALEKGEIDKALSELTSGFFDETVPYCRRQDNTHNIVGAFYQNLFSTTTLETAKKRTVLFLSRILNDPASLHDRTRDLGDEQPDIGVG